jgi:hypothetical protein
MKTIFEPQSMDEHVKSVCLDFPLLGGKYLAQLVLPRALCKQDAERLIGLIKCWPQTEDDKLPMGSSVSAGEKQA